MSYYVRPGENMNEVYLKGSRLSDITDDRELILCLAQLFVAELFLSAEIESHFWEFVKGRPDP